MTSQSQKALPSATTDQLTRPLQEQDRIESALRSMAIRLDKVLTEPVIRQWYQDLGTYPVAAIEYAADWCGRNLEKWPKWKQFAIALDVWLGCREEDAGQVRLPSRAEIERSRAEFRKWYNSPEAAYVRNLVQQLDKKMNTGRPRLYTPQELEGFKKVRR
jgi:hypothetical protein